MPHPWFDAHLDLACLALEGRDMLCSDPRASGGSNPPGAITLPSLRAGNVRSALATIFIEPDGDLPAISYTSGNSPDAIDSACAAAARQMDLYEAWANEGHVRLSHPGKPVSTQDNLTSLAILVEGADGIRSPDELVAWVERGVVAVGLAWAKQTRYAGGNSCETGLTDLGRAMIREMDRLGVVHDAAHLSDASLAELFSLTDERIIATHANCRTILDDGSLNLGQRQRHLTDDSIREIGKRAGMIGSVLYSPFITPGSAKGMRATLSQWAAHVDRTCELMGSRAQIGLGSDADGGFSADTLPEGISDPNGYERLAETLSARGWSEAEVEGFAWGNWARFWASDA